MGQVALGLRSLLVRLAVFFVLAVLLAWALGGTLWPRPTIVNDPDLRVELAGQVHYWQLVAGGRDPDLYFWRMMTRDSEGNRESDVDLRRWRNVVGPFIARGQQSDRQAVFYGGQVLSDHRPDRWLIVERSEAGLLHLHPMPDRFKLYDRLQKLTSGQHVNDQPVESQQSPLTDSPPRR